MSGVALTIQDLDPHSRITSIELKSQDIGTDEAELVADYISHTSTLTSLCLDSNPRLGSKGITSIVSACCNNTNITELSIREIGLTADSASFLLQHLRKNFSLLKIEIEEKGSLIQDNSITELYGTRVTTSFDINVLTKRLLRICESNKSLKNLSSGNGVDCRLRSRFLSAEDVPNFIFEQFQPKTADFSFNPLQTIPLSIKNWKSSLETLSIDSSQIQAFPAEIGLLFGLKTLSMSENEIETIPASIGLLTNLNSLNLSKNKIRILPHILGTLKSLKTLDVSNNPLHSKDSMIPKEIITSGSETVLKFMKESALHDKEKVFKMKLMFIGNGNVGKTSLLNCFLSKKKSTLEKPSPNIATDGIDIHDWVIPNISGKHDLSFSVWDFAGQDVYYATHQFFLSSRSIFILVFNLQQTMEEGRIEYWLNNISARSPSVPVFLVGTHLDDKVICTKKYVQNYFDTLINKFSKKFKNISFHIGVSTLTSKNIDTLKSKLIKVAQNQSHLGELIPKSWLLFEEKIKVVKELNQYPILSWTTFSKMAKDCGVEENQIKKLSSFLHDVGSVVSYADDGEGLGEIVTLDSQWLTRVFSTLITMKPNSVRGGIILRSDLSHIWKPPQFPPESHNFLLSLLSKFELLFQFHGSDKILVPSLLSDERPSLLQINTVWRPQQDLSTQRSRIYKFGFLPPGFFGRLTIRMLHSDWTAALYWSNGLICCKVPDKRLYIDLEPDYKLQIRFRGSDILTEILPVFQSLDSLIHDWLQVKVNIGIPCPHCVSNVNLDIHEFSMANCETAVAKAIPSLRCPIGGVDIPIEDLTPDIALSNLQVPKCKFEEFQQMTKIGEGGYAQVYSAVWRGKQVAIKQMNLERMDDFSFEPVSVIQIFSEFRKEVWMMSCIRHPKLVVLHAISMNPFCMVMEFMDKGSLYEFVRTPECQDWDCRINLAVDIAEGMAYLHSLEPPMIHRDLKSPNVLLQTGYDRVIAKVADFGLSRSMEFSTRISGKVVDNPIWLPPEILKKQKYDEKVDVYAYGVILWEISHGEDFFGEINFLSEMEKLIISGERPPINPDTFSEFSNLIRECWDGEPQNRPSFVKIVETFIEVWGVGVLPERRKNTQRMGPLLYEPVFAPLEGSRRGLAVPNARSVLARCSTTTAFNRSNDDSASDTKDNRRTFSDKGPSHREKKKKEKKKK